MGIRGVYIHIPFCHQICNYCDFNKVFFKNQPVDAYIESVGEELRLYATEQPGRFDNVETIFLGGGTPTALTAAQITRLLELVRTYIPQQTVVEFTSEANPDELSRDKLEALFAGGVNRLSMGVQSFDEELLKKIGRTHSNEHVFETVALAREVGFTNISIDLMYGLPNQTLEQWQDTLQTALTLDLPHFSAYSLLVEPKTVFYIQYNKGKLALPTEDLEATMYGHLIDEMERRGLKQYEISNFAKDGYASVHNKIYWDNDEYAGFGAGAHGYVDGVRYSNHGPIKKYMEALAAGEKPIIHEHTVTRDERLEEQMFLGLRKTDGVTHDEFMRKFGVPMMDVFGEVIASEVELERLIHDEDGVRLTRRGRFIGNEVFQQFLL
ncbi:MAG: radical SAM family heme chaperone HemW [Caryophanon sp.]|nr:radical SAM family heme chaperone HemW [Caryophanon sp.]